MEYVNDPITSSDGWSTRIVSNEKSWNSLNIISSMMCHAIL